MKALIYIEAPTQYQLQSLNRFGLPVKQSPFGQYYSAMIFDTVTAARDFFKLQADFEFEDEPKKIKRNLSRYALTIDAVTGRILIGDEAANKIKDLKLK
jgi:hypothetical protein